MIIVGATLALVIAIVAGITVWSKSSSDPTAAGPASGQPSGRTSTNAAPTTRAGVVRAYLNALAAGDAGTALSYFKTKPHDTSMLTDQVLRASIKMAPITKINVPEVRNPDAVTVSAGYLLGKSRVHTTFIVVDKEGSFRIQDGSSDLDLSSYTRGLKVKINGTTPKSSELTLFPGAYRISTATRYVDLGDDDTFTLLSPSSAASVNIDPQLSSAGKKMFRSKVTAAVNDCLASDKLRPGCGLKAPKSIQDFRSDDGTVNWTLDSADRAVLKTVSPGLNYSAPTIAEASLIISATAKFHCANSQTAGTCSSRSFVGDPVIDLTDPDLELKWQ